MKRVISTIILFLASTLFASAFDWSSIYDRTVLSIAQVQTSHSTCTAFSINEEQAYFMTAAHCLGEELFLLKEEVPGLGVHGRVEVLQVAYNNAEKDIAILQAEVGLPILVRGKTPRVGKEAVVIGYAYGESTPMLLASHVAMLRDLRMYGIPRKVVIRDTVDISGMSGGPVLDTDGRVFAVIQQTVRGRLSWGTTMEEIYSLTRGYWAS